MALPGEASHPNRCTDCGDRLELKVLYSNAGHYIGTACSCGPYSRESGYYPNRETAEHALKVEGFCR